MDHSQALQEKAAERYLLNEMTPGARDSFEAHFFDCPECAIDLRAGAAFIEQSRAQLPALTGVSPAPGHSRSSVAAKSRSAWWQGVFRPVFAAPAFATLLLIFGYQNLVTYPALKASANQPHLLPWAPLHGATRGAPLSIAADREHGVALPVDLPSQAGSGAYASYSFDLHDPAGKLVWTGLANAPADSAGDEQRLSLVIPGSMLQNGAYTIAVSGVGARGERTEIDKYVIDLHLSD